MLRLGGLLFVAAASALVSADSQAECVEPSVVKELNAKIEQLESSNNQWTTKYDTAKAEWEATKGELESKLEKQDSADERAQMLEKKLTEAQSAHEKQVRSLESKASDLEKQAGELQKQLNEEKDAGKLRDSELKDTQTELAKLQKQIKALEREIQQSRKKNEALRLELDSMDDKLTLAALLSSYYDQSVDIAGKTMETISVRAAQWQESSSALSEAAKMLETAKKTTLETSTKLYREHLAESVDPLLEKAQQAAAPHIDKYTPIAQQYAKKVRVEAWKNYVIFQHRAHTARNQAIAAVQQHEQVAPYASKIVDGAILIVVFPFVYMVVRLALRLIWSIIYAVLWVLTFGCCFTRCSKKRSKLKRKPSRKNLATGPAPTMNASSTTDNSPASAGRRKSGSKKGKKKQTP